MRSFFKKKKPEKKLPVLQDLDGSPLIEGDTVESFRYELGTCRVILDDGVFYYESTNNGRKVSYFQMIDAITGHQKVRLVS